MAITLVGDLPVEITVSNGSTTIKRVGECKCCAHGEPPLAKKEDEALGFNGSDGEEDRSDEDNSDDEIEPIAESFDVEVGLGGLDGIRATLDTGAYSNVLPMNVFEKSGLGNLEEEKSIVQFADGSLVRPVGIVRNVLMRIGGTSVYTNFLVMPASSHGLSDVVLLGRSFLSNVHAVIDTYRRTCAIEVDGEQHTLQAIAAPNNFYNVAHPIGFFGPAAFVYSHSQVHGTKRSCTKGKASTRRNRN